MFFIQFVGGHQQLFHLLTLLSVAAAHTVCLTPEPEATFIKNTLKTSKEPAPFIPGANRSTPLLYHSLPKMNSTWEEALGKRDNLTLLDKTVCIFCNYFYSILTLFPSIARINLLMTKLSFLCMVKTRRIHNCSASADNWKGLPSSQVKLGLYLTLKVGGVYCHHGH